MEALWSFNLLSESGSALFKHFHSATLISSPRLKVSGGQEYILVSKTDLQEFTQIFRNAQEALQVIRGLADDSD
jgi:hypothetical protein